MRRRDWATGLLVALIVGVTVSVFSDRLSGVSVDFLFWLREHIAPQIRQADQSPTVIVAIDEETYRRPPFVNVPNALWTHEIAAVLNALIDADAKVIGFDIIFPTSMDRYVPGFDRDFLTALRRASIVNKVVLGEVQFQQSPIRPFPAQSFAVGNEKNTRFLNLFDDDDGVIRRVPLSFMRTINPDGSRQRRENSFAAELAARTLERKPLVVPESELMLNFHDSDAIPSFSLADLVACTAQGKAAFFRAHFAGKIVVIGTMLDVEDRKLTSMRLITQPEHGASSERCASSPMIGLFRAEARRDSIPGVYVIATAINNLLQHDALRELSRLMTAIVIVAAAFAALLVALLLRPLAACGVMLGAGVFWTVVATGAFHHNLVLPLLAPPVAAGLTLALLVGYRFAVTDRDRRLLRRSFAFYVAPALIDRVLASEKLPELGGEMRRVTILMSDLADFTKMSEQLSPAELVAVMNEYFTAMSEIIEREGGFVQDYAGDAILAAFGAPLEDPEHAFHASRAALDCRDRLAQLEQTGHSLRGKRLRARIGLNTGDVLVGNIGSTRRLKYTAMGDTVNLAARLETINKAYGTTILATRSTRAAAGTNIVWREVDRVRVVGRDQPVELFEPLGVLGTVSPEETAIVDGYAEALAAYRAADFTRAATLFAPLRENDPPSHVLAQRLVELQTVPPANWDGTTDFNTK